VKRRVLLLHHSADGDMSERPKGDRRRNRRYPVELALVCRTVGRGQRDQGPGKTENISSHGLLFRADARLHPDEEVELTIRWPVLLDHATRLNWVVRGRVVRCDVAGCAVRISSHEFRTRGSAISPAEAISAQSAALGMLIAPLPASPEEAYAAHRFALRPAAGERRLFAAGNKRVAVLSTGAGAIRRLG
jgi:hypothetical protein